ncbi:MAG: DUF3291 domain-containing protein [Acidimicrobiales bacterium]
MYLAEANVAKLRAPLDDTTMSGLRKALADVFWLADQSPGFVWRHTPEEGQALAYGQLDGMEVVVTLSLWMDFPALQRYVYRTAHGLFMQRRGRWFEPIGGFTTAMWWVPDDERPTVDEGLTRLRLLRDQGPTPLAFSLRRQFDPDGGRVIV